MVPATKGYPTAFCTTVNGSDKDKGICCVPLTCPDPGMKPVSACFIPYGNQNYIAGGHPKATCKPFSGFGGMATFGACCEPKRKHHYAKNEILCDYVY